MPLSPARSPLSLLPAFAALIVSIAASLAPARTSAQSATPSGSQTVVTTDQVRAEIMAYAPDGVGPDKPVWVGLQIAHQPEWHTYWKNAGDSGLPTSVQWTLPKGVTAGEIAWPMPHKIPLGNLANYGYEGTVLLPVPLTVTPDFKPSLIGDTLEVKLKATWLVCRKECIPQDGAFTIKIPAKGSTALQAQAFNDTMAQHPRDLPAGAGSVAIAGKTIQVSVSGLPAEVRGKTLEFYPETAEVIETAAPYTQAWNGDVWTGTIPLSAQRSASPTVMPVVLATGDGATRQGWRAEAKVEGEWTKVAGALGVSPQLEAALRANAAAGGAPIGGNGVTSLVAALLAALLGGLILNLMPCVFPVLAIKLVGFGGQGGQSPRALRLHGLAYAAGVVLSFVALGALMLALRAAGEQLGWGFQLQSPIVVALLAGLFTLIGLNLAGLFEFGGIVPQGLASAEAKHPAVNALLSGGLAVAIASPCTAPFMGASLGFAVGLPAVQALLVFAAIGVGMALPVVLASAVPALARALPRPGPWMDTFRRLMAFPMFATVAWLVWVLGQQTGIDGAAALLVLLVVGAMVVWALTLAGRTRLVIASLSIAGFAALAGTIGQNVTKLAETTAAAPASGPWQAWEPGRVEQLTAAGQPVFVDFTAAWCVTCQYNKKTTLAHADVLADFDNKKVALLRADWTRRDPAISAALNGLGRNGVPLYVVYAPGKPPVLLSEVLSVDEVRAALARL